MKIFAVGGSVRDELLGIVPKDHDYVVVGATPTEMLELGYDQVGASFPVFLHPTTRDEYALARTERKSGVGYHGFETDYNPDVTLEDDLRRRDLTINSMAKDLETGELIDPYGGKHDLFELTLRHTSEAFAEDPVRVLRTARFAARYAVFTVADETLELMNKVMHELKHVPQERIWAEFEKGLMEKRPNRMFEVLDNVGAFNLPALKAYKRADMPKLRKVQERHDLVVRFVLAGAGFDDSDFERYRIPSDCADVCQVFNQYFDDLCTYPQYNKKQRLELLYNWRAFSRPWLLDKVCEALGFFQEGYQTIEWIQEDIQRTKSVDAAAVAATCQNGSEIKVKLFEARLATL